MASPQRPVAPAGDQSPLERDLASALKGDATALVDLLIRSSGLPGPRPSYRLAMVFGQIAKKARAKAPQRMDTLLDLLSSDEGDSGTGKVFLPICAAFPTAMLMADNRPARVRMAHLASDPRHEVRFGVVEALIASGVILDADPDRLLGLSSECDPIDRWYAADTIFRCLAREELRHDANLATAALPWAEAMLADIKASNRAQERNPARRIGLDGAKVALHGLVTRAKGGQDWFAKLIELGTHPDLRVLFEHTLTQLRRKGSGQKDDELMRFATAIDTTKKPPRDPTLFRQDTRGRGRSRRTQNSGK